MNMVGVNPAAGGPVGGGMMMMNNGALAAPNTPSNANSQENMKLKLNTYIYEYFLKLGHHDHARALLRDEKFSISTKHATKTSPGRRREGELNGVDENSMDTESKDDFNIPDDLPRPDLPSDCPQSTFLLDWFCLFFDIFAAQRNKKPGPDNPASQYLQQTQVGLHDKQQNISNANRLCNECENVTRMHS